MTYQEARRKARYGHRDWLFWRDRDGGYHAEPETADSLKRAMLAVGVRGAFTSISASTGVGSRITWGLAVLHWRNARKVWATPTNQPPTPPESKEPTND